MDELKGYEEKRILVTGSNGFLGQKLIDKLAGVENVSLLATSKGDNRNPNILGYIFKACDIENEASFHELVESFAPTHIIHTAAITSVEACDRDPLLCERVNVLFVGKLASLCEKLEIHLTFLSTDFVFDGKDGPYHENDMPNPCNAYGRSKWLAEQAIMKTNSTAAILRTILVYGVINDPKRSNLILWVKNKLSQGESITVVSDQWRMPTWVDDLADACILAVEKRASGIYHISSEQLFSILEIAEQVADSWQLNKQLIQPISAADIGQADNRPAKTGFILTKSMKELGFRPTSLLKSFEEIKTQLALYNRV
ncbi:SDR family oxidoreductase [Sphingobacterium deserti]|uniref:dTDP-4-dehydrorhamnose reductase n=1 Tax=Sphingobacterium deserti TaxID=1229276 RepID=A0A0B8T2C3_9SPHI|nr:SDR family oxidoreductase [Sphingobacterium deserti]KGE15387.1 dTDP-4-dehydrorhamnose reductase [Sphingobacterium deserti]